MTEGALGALTDEYVLIRAAKYLGVAPWELLAQPLFWQRKAILYERVDQNVQQELQKQAEAEAAARN